MTKREQIIKTTIRLVSEMGLYATSMGLIIKESNVAAGTIYHYFNSKENLIKTVYSELKEEMGKTFTHNMNNVMPYKEKFFFIWKNLFYYFKANPQKFQFIEHYASSPLEKNEVKEINQRHYQPAIDFIRKGIEMGYLRTLPEQFIIQLIFAHVSVVVRMILFDKIETSVTLLHQFIQSSWDSVRIN
ncbi:MAG TPA: TetR/AcrR family transcriptional regulator [Bacteroidales bacterium]|nr:TetR/AcrR family transcriptional regulator [Bacteroidales bacterium]